MPLCWSAENLLKLNTTPSYISYILELAVYTTSALGFSFSHFSASVHSICHVSVTLPHFTTLCCYWNLSIGTKGRGWKHELEVLQIILLNNAAMAVVHTLKWTFIYYSTRGIFVTSANSISAHFSNAICLKIYTHRDALWSSTPSNSVTMLSLSNVVFSVLKFSGCATSALTGISGSS